MSAADVAKHREGQKTRAAEPRRRNPHTRACRASAPSREGPNWVERKIQDWYRKKVKRSVARLVDRHDSD
ncbi:hypothetical protein SB780_35085, partial [Burkholderia sp. SIMBA_057]